MAFLGLVEDFCSNSRWPSLADIVIFDPEKIIDNATWEKPHQYPSGILWVIVNGSISINNGKLSNQLYGKILKHHES